METNHNDVITAVSAEKARELLDHAALIEDALTALTGESERSRNARIGDLNNELGLTLKLAHIHATLAIADEIRSAVGADRQRSMHRFYADQFTAASGQSL